MVGQRAVRSIFCCLLLSSNILTDAYGVSQQGGKKSNNKDKSQAPVAKKHQTHGTAVVRNNEISKDRSILKTQSPKTVMVHETLKPEEKLILEITELKRMHQQLIKETNKGSNDARKLQLLKHIEKQIQIRQGKQQRNQRKSQVVSDQNKHVTTARKVPQLFSPVQSVTAHSNSGPHNNVVQTLVQPTAAQQKVQHGIKMQKQEPQPFETNRQVQLQTQISNHMRPQSSRQQNNIVSTNQLLLPHFIRKGPLTVNTHQLNGTIAQQIPSQQAGFLIPVSALSSQHILNGQGLLQDKIVLVNPMFKYNANQGNSRAAPTTQLPKPSPTPSKTTTTSTTTTALPSTTISTPAPTSTSVPESTTAIDMETLEQTLLKRSMKKQELEIRKLRLEIRALQREERNNLPEMENDDLPQQRRGQVGRRRLIPPYIR